MTRNKWIIVLVLLTGAVVFTVLLNARSSGPDRAACRDAMRKQFSYGMTHPDAPAGTRPGACKGISDADLQKITSEIMNDYLTQGSS